MTSAGRCAAVSIAYPPAVGAEVDTLVSASRRLREKRELACYGDEETDTEAESLFSRADADDALRMARHVMLICTGAKL